MLRKLRKRRRAGWELGNAGPFLDHPRVDRLLGSVYLAVMSLRERSRPGLGIIEPCLPSPAKAPPSKREAEDWGRHNR
jgi:hypothetical protein